MESDDDEMKSDDDEMKSDDDPTSELDPESTSLEKLFEKAVLNVKDALDQMKPAVKKDNITAYLRLNKVLLGLQLWGDDIRVEKETLPAIDPKAPSFVVVSKVHEFLLDISVVSLSLREYDFAHILSE